jgi:hypothetical protein
MTDCMATRIENPSTAHLATLHSPGNSMGTRVIPIPSTAVPNITMSAPGDASAGEPMDIGSPQGTSPSDLRTAADTNGKSEPTSRDPSGSDQNSSSSTMPAPPPAAAAVHQPKIVQTAFIHKLYNMLEDPNIQHLISWSASAESFIMSPSADFSKVLSYASAPSPTATNRGAASLTDLLVNTSNIPTSRHSCDS